MCRFLDALHDRPLVLDAAMGTRLIARGLDLTSDDPCLWNLSRPEDVRDIHLRDIAAGADAVLTNTFGANRQWLARLGRATEDVAINTRAAVLAREAAGPARFVLGDLGPTGLSDPTGYVRQAEALAAAGVDAVFLETHTIEQAASGLALLRDRTGRPLLVGLFVGPDDGLRDGLARLRDAGADALGVNCIAPRHAREIITQLVEMGIDLPLIVKPSAEPATDPDVWRADLGLWPDVPEGRSLTTRVRFLGGCCGTDERHIGLLREAVDHREGRPAFPRLKTFETRET